MELLGWFLYRNLKDEKSTNILKSEIPTNAEIEKVSSIVVEKPAESSAVSDFNESSFPPPSVEIIDGVSQRTIHMGARQWQWDPYELSVNYGEKVILIMHNADVPHSIAIPSLNVDVEIPEEGAVVTFMADKRGTFDFFCAVPCGRGHSQMKGRIIVT